MQALRVDSSGNLKAVGAGVAGTPAGGVLSVQGVSGGQAVPISAASLPLPTGAATESTLQTVAILSSSISTNTSLTAANTSSIAASSTTSSNSLISIDAKTPALVGGSVPCVLTAGSAVVGAVTQSGTWTVALSAGSAVIGHVITDSGSTTAVTGNVTVVQPTAASLNATVVGTGTFAVQAAQSGTWTVQPGNTQNTTPWLVGDVPLTSGGLSVYSLLQTSAAVIAANVKGSAGQVYGVECFNVGAAAVYVRLYDKSSTPATTDTPLWRGVIPGNTAGAGFVKSWPQGLACANGIGVRVTGAIADNDATALAANQVIINMDYK